MENGVSVLESIRHFVMLLTKDTHGHISFAPFHRSDPRAP